MNSELPSSEIGVADFFDNEEISAACDLIARAPHVLVISYCVGAPKTAEYFTKRLKKIVTEKMIKTLKCKVSMGIFLVTREELEKAALSHPITAARMLREPAMCDPHYYCRTFIADPEENLTTFVVNKTAKKAAKLENANATPPSKSAEKKRFEEAAVSKETNKLLHEVDAELRAAGVLID